MSDRCMGTSATGRETKECSNRGKSTQDFPVGVRVRAGDAGRTGGLQLNREIFGCKVVNASYQVRSICNLTGLNHASIPIYPENQPILHNPWHLLYAIVAMFVVGRYESSGPPCQDSNDVVEMIVCFHRPSSQSLPTSAMKV